MTIRGYIALFYGIAAMGVSVLADQVPALDLPAQANVMVIIADHAQVTLYEIDPDASGDFENGDLPAYLSEDEADFARGQDGALELAARGNL